MPALQLPPCRFIMPIMVIMDIPLIGCGEGGDASPTGLLKIALFCVGFGLWKLLGREGTDTWGPEGKFKVEDGLLG